MILIIDYNYHMIKNILNLEELAIHGGRVKASMAYRGQYLPRIQKHSRHIFLYGPYVIKYDHDRDQNENEVLFYNRIRFKDRCYFPALIAYDREKGVIVQEYVPLIQDNDRITKRIENTIDRLIAKYNIDDICAYSMRNWGLNAISGKPVIFDVGISG